MSRLLISQEIDMDNLFKWIKVVKTIFESYYHEYLLTLNGKEKAIVIPHFPDENIYREMFLYFNKHKLKKAACDFSIEEKNIEVTITGYCSWYIFSNPEDNFFFDNQKEGG